MPRTRTIAALAAVLATVVLGVAALGAVAQTGAESPIEGSPPESTTTTTAPNPILDPFATTTTTGATTTTVPAGQAPDDSKLPEGGGDGPVPPGVSQVVPPEFQKLINSVKRSRPNSTAKLLAALRPLLYLGLSEEEAVAIGFGRFPVGGVSKFTDDWWNPRFVPSFHLHEGTDIFAAFGTPVRSPADGVLRHAEGAVGGLASYVTTDNGTYFYMAHLSGYPEGQVTGQRVKTGEIVGFVGDSGNARGGAPHLHFEIHPAPTKSVTTGKGRNKVTELVTRPVKPGTVLPATNPKPYLDQWLTDAIAQVPAAIAQFEANRPRAVIATGLTRQFGEAGGQFTFRSTPPLEQLLWASSASPSGGVLQLAQAEAAEATRDLDWEVLSRRVEARARAWQAADERARAGLALVAPAPLVALLGWEATAR